MAEATSIPAAAIVASLLERHGPQLQVVSQQRDQPELPLETKTQLLNEELLHKPGTCSSSESPKLVPC